VITMLYYSDFTIEFQRMTQGVGVSIMEKLECVESDITIAGDLAIDHLGRAMLDRDYDREINDDPDDCDRAIVWTSKDRRDVIIARITESGPGKWIPWEVCADCVDAIHGLSDDPSTRDRVAPELLRDTETMGPIGDPCFSWSSCDSCGSHLGGDRAIYLTLNKREGC
jgi:hypothetical protein